MVKINFKEKNFSPGRISSPLPRIQYVTGSGWDSTKHSSVTFWPISAVYCRAGTRTIGATIKKEKDTYLRFNDGGADGQPNFCWGNLQSTVTRIRLLTVGDTPLDAMQWYAPALSRWMLKIFNTEPSWAVTSLP